MADRNLPSRREERTPTPRRRYDPAAIVLRRIYQALYWTAGVVVTGSLTGGLVFGRGWLVALAGAAAALLFALGGIVVELVEKGRPSAEDFNEEE